MVAAVAQRTMLTHVDELPVKWAFSPASTSPQTECTIISSARSASFSNEMTSASNSVPSITSVPLLLGLGSMGTPSMRDRSDFWRPISAHSSRKNWQPRFSLHGQDIATRAAHQVISPCFACGTDVPGANECLAETLYPLYAVCETLRIPRSAHTL